MMLIKIIDLQMILPLLYYILTLNVVLICAVFHQKIHKNVGNIFVQLSNNLLEILVEIQIFAIKDVFEIPTFITTKSSTRLVPSLFILIGVP